MIESQKIINNILNRENRTRAFAMIETLILKVMNKYLEDQNKEFYPNFIEVRNEREFMEVDGYAPQGFDEYDGETVIEIKLYKRKESLLISRAERFVENVMKKMRI